MNFYTTEIQALDPITNELKLWEGPKIPAISFSDAEDYCQRHGFGYCKVTGILTGEIDTHEDDLTPNWSTKVSWENLN